MKIPESILHAKCQNQTSELNRAKNVTKTLFRTKVVVINDCIHIEGEGAPNVIGLFKGNTQEKSSMNRYDCDFADLPVIILQQVYHVTLAMNLSGLLCDGKVTYNMLGFLFARNLVLTLCWEPTGLASTKGCLSLVQLSFEI